MSEVEVNSDQGTFVYAGAGSKSSGSPVVVLPSAGPQLITPTTEQQAYAAAAARASARTIFRRAASTQDDGDSNSMDRHTSRSAWASSGATKRSSFYQSGTQSAYGSRDASPDKLGKPRKVTPYPMAPPSMIISPSMTPRRAPSVERDTNTLTERDMQRLYSKLGQIETESDHSLSRSISRERGKGIRLLIKSVSIDSTDEESPNWVPSVSAYTNGDRSPQRQQQNGDKKQPPYSIIAKLHSGLFEDAPLSQTLPASIRIGELVITPGIQTLTHKERHSRRTRSESVDPRTARKAFYENYPKEKSGFPALSTETVDKQSEYRPRLDSSSSVEQESSVISKSDRLDSEQSRKSRGRPVSRYDSDIEEIDTSSKSRTKSSFSAADLIKSVKSKRKLFGLKRSSSVETSHVGSSTYLAGVHALSAGAPTGFAPPGTDDAGDDSQAEGKDRKSKKEKKEKKEKKKSKEKEEKTKAKEEKELKKENKDKKKKHHKRAASVDLTLISTSQDAASGVVSTIFKQDKKKSSKKHGNEHGTFDDQ